MWLLTNKLVSVLNGFKYLKVAIKTEDGEESSEHASPEKEKWNGRDSAGFVSRQIVRFAEVFFYVSGRHSDLRVDHRQFIVFRRFRQNSTENDFNREIYWNLQTTHSLFGKYS